MYNFDLWYCAGIVIIGASFSYIAFSAAQVMGLRKKNQKSLSEQPEPQTQFLRHALLAFVGIMVGAQLLQYHQDQQELVAKNIVKEMALARTVSSTPGGITGTIGIVAANSLRLGTRPASRPPRGYFSVAEAEKAAATSSGVVLVTPDVSVKPLTLSVPPSASVVVSSGDEAIVKK